MSIPVLESHRKRKRRPKLFGFHTFANPGCPINPTGTFRDNIRVFLREAAECEDLNTWCTLLLHETRSFLIPLYTVEENVMKSSKPNCDHCRCSGWSNHFVSKRKYHVIIPSNDEWSKPLDDRVFDSQTHLLHGLIHCNGFGHLLCINGIEGGSKFLCGREIMDLWDRLCAMLHTRKITVEDVSRKHAMDLRLLYGVAYGHPWFGRWGYKFCRGSFGVTQLNYDRAIEILCPMELDQVIRDFANTGNCREVEQIICCYRHLSETLLITMKDLFKFMLTVKSCFPAQMKSSNVPAAITTSLLKPSTRSAMQRMNRAKEKSLKCKRFSSIVSNMDSRWPARRLEFTAQVIVDALKEKKDSMGGGGGGGMTRQDVRDAARLHIGDTGLLDYVLKSLNNVIVGDYIVRRAVNPSTRILEYTIHELGRNNGMSVTETKPEICPEPFPATQSLEAGTNVYSDVVTLYTNVLLNYPESEVANLATQAVLDSKHFVREWPFKDDNDQLLRFICQVMPCLSDRETEFNRELPPGEIVVVPLHATVWDLKRAAEIALRDTYCITDRLVVTEIVDMEEMDDGEVLFGAVESGMQIWVRGRGIDMGNQYRYEGGTGNWTVKCECGARDDDGERMVACDICEAWQHTRCCGIDDAETVPPLFVCQGCCLSLVPPRNEPAFEFESSSSLSFQPVGEYRLVNTSTNTSVGTQLSSVSAW